MTIDVSAIPFLHYEELASDNGGPIAARRSEKRLIPESAYYQLEATVNGDAPGWGNSRQQSGMLVIEGASRSWLGKQARRVIAVFLRETGF
jgi:putative peptide zinc metalloprotease protein